METILNTFIQSIHKANEWQRKNKSFSDSIIVFVFELRNSITNKLIENDVWIENSIPVCCSQTIQIDMVFSPNEADIDTISKSNVERINIIKNIF